MKIADLAKLKESEDNVEFKAATKNFPFAGGKHTDQNERRKCFLGYVVAFCNEGGGRLILGMSDDYPHTPVGTNFAEGTIGALEDETYKRLDIRVKMDEIIENGLRVLVVNIPGRPVGRTIKFEGVALMRVGESLMNMSDEEMFKILSEQEPDFSAKICEGLQLSDLDEQAIDIMKTAYARKQSNPFFSSLSNEQVLSDLGLYTDGKLNYAALILLGKKEFIDKLLPHAKTIYEFRFTNAQINYDVREVIGGPLFIGIDKIWSLINSKNSVIPVRSGTYIFNANTFNEEVIREALLNAITHRDYSIGSEVVIKQYPRHITIENPGGFPKGVSIENILSVSSTPRSRRMAEVLEKTGLVERSGQGVDKIFSITLEEGKALPDYNNSGLFQVTLKLTGELEDKAFHIFLSQEQAKRSADQKLSVEQIVALHNIKIGQFNAVKPAILNNLEKDGLIIKLTGHTNRYTLPDEYNRLSSVSQRIGSRYIVSEVSRLLLALQNNQLPIGQLENTLANALTRNQLKFLIQKLMEDGVIVSEGNAKATRYKISPEFEGLRGDSLVNNILDTLGTKYDG